VPQHIIDEPEYRNRRFIFKNRLHAGELLADRFPSLKRENSQILAIPSGGVPVGYAMAKKFRIPFDVIIVRKIQIPWNTEAGFGALAWDGTLVLNDQLASALGLSPEVVQQGITRTEQIIRERLRRFRGGRPMPDLENRQAVLVDDGLASGFTMLAAIRSIKKEKPEKIIVAVPTASEGSVELIAPNVDELFCLNLRGGPVFAVADAYQHWYDLSDEEVTRFLS
jgi:predicted phosphoribosyltransferase